MTARPFTVERLSRRTPAPQTAPLPEPAVAALAEIADELRHTPRDCLIDRAELITWLNRLARRVTGVAEMKVVTPTTGRSTPRTRTAPCRAVTHREVAEAVFGKATPSKAAGRDLFRTITTRKGRSVRVETRRAPGQMDLWS